MITVFTATYNRKELLKRLYLSLTQQTCKDFEWLVIDDGGTDGTDIWMSELKAAKHDFPVLFSRQENGGKHRAINKGVQLAHGEYFFIVDDDDLLVPNAIQQVSDWINDLKKEPDYSVFAGVSGLRKLSSGSVINEKLDGPEYIDALYTETGKNGLLGDKAEIYKTEILKKFPFPEFEGEKFVSESTVWNEIAGKGYKIRWYLKPIYICEYLDGGLSKNLKRNELNSFQGLTYQTKQNIRLGSIKTRINSISRYADRAEEKGYTLNQAAKLLDISKTRMIACKFVMKCFRFFKPERTL